MIRSFKLAGIAATAAFLLSAGAPAEARPHGWDGRGDGGWDHRGGGGLSFGDVVLGAAIIGGVAAVANAVANGSRNRDNELYGDAPPRWNGDRYENGAPRAGNARPSAEEDAAVERCADAAEQQAGPDFRVDSIRYVDRDGAGWRVEGALAERRGYRQTFVCGVRAAAVDFVQLGEPLAAR